MTEKKGTFEEYLKQVEEAVKALESGKLGLEESLVRYESGVKAIRKCYEILGEVEKKIEILVKEKDGSVKTKDFGQSKSENR
jgi:exodeoxyribonuclease VII small subunit